MTIDELLAKINAVSGISEKEMIKPLCSIIDELEHVPDWVIEPRLNEVLEALYKKSPNLAMMVAKGIMLKSAEADLQVVELSKLPEDYKNNSIKEMKTKIEGLTLQLEQLQRYFATL